MELSFLVDEGVPRSVVGDSGRLRQILTNLLGNAVKFTEQGEVALRVTVVPSESDALVLHFEILDTSIGIAAEVMERIFESFAQADGSTTRQYGGTGLGLAIARQLVELHGRQIGADSTPGEGSRFWFTARARRADTAAPDRRSAAQDFAGRRVRRRRAGPSTWPSST